MNAADDDLQQLLAQLDPQSRGLIAEIDLGNEAKDFLRSQVGQYIVGCAQQEIIDAQDQLSRVLWWRRRRIQELQNRVWRAHSLLNWLRDLLINAKSAESAIAEGEQDG